MVYPTGRGLTGHEDDGNDKLVGTDKPDTVSALRREMTALIQRAERIESMEIEATMDCMVVIKRIS